VKPGLPSVVLTKEGPIGPTFVIPGLTRDPGKKRENSNSFIRIFLYSYILLLINIPPSPSSKTVPVRVRPIRPIGPIGPKNPTRPIGLTSLSLILKTYHFRINNPPNPNSTTVYGSGIVAIQASSNPSGLIPFPAMVLPSKEIPSAEHKVQPVKSN
jgi:hypothetical protein